MSHEPYRLPSLLAALAVCELPDADQRALWLRALLRQNGEIIELVLSHLFDAVIKRFRWGQRNLRAAPVQNTRLHKYYLSPSFASASGVAVHLFLTRYLPQLPGFDGLRQDETKGLIWHARLASRRALCQRYDTAPPRWNAGVWRPTRYELPGSRAIEDAGHLVDMTPILPMTNDELPNALGRHRDLAEAARLRGWLDPTERWHAGRFPKLICATGYGCWSYYLGPLTVAVNAFLWYTPLPRGDSPVIVPAGQLPTYKPGCTLEWDGRGHLFQAPEPSRYDTGEHVGSLSVRDVLGKVALQIGTIPVQMIWIYSTTATYIKKVFVGQDGQRSVLHATLSLPFGKVMFFLGAGAACLRQEWDDLICTLAARYGSGKVELFVVETAGMAQQHSKSELWFASDGQTRWLVNVEGSANLSQIGSNLAAFVGESGQRAKPVSFESGIANVVPFDGPTARRILDQWNERINWAARHDRLQPYTYGTSSQDRAQVPSFAALAQQSRETAKASWQLRGALSKAHADFRRLETLDITPAVPSETRSDESAFSYLEALERDSWKDPSAAKEPIDFSSGQLEEAPTLSILARAGNLLSSKGAGRQGVLTVRSDIKCVNFDSTSDPCKSFLTLAGLANKYVTCDRCRHRRRDAAQQAAAANGPDSQVCGRVLKRFGKCGRAATILVCTVGAPAGKKICPPCAKTLKGRAPQFEGAYKAPPAISVEVPALADVATLVKTHSLAKLTIPSMLAFLDKHDAPAGPKGQKKADVMQKVERYFESHPVA